MGMFDRDKEIGLALGVAFDEKEEFVLYGIGVDKDLVKIPESNLPPARRTRLQVARLENPGQQFEITSLGSAIADKAEEADDDDFPCIVIWMVVPTKMQDATIIRHIRDGSQ